MKDSNYWKTFADTGSVADYLRFKEDEKNRKDKTGEESYAGFCNNHRNDHKDSAYRGFR